MGGRARPVDLRIEPGAHRKRATSRRSDLAHPLLLAGRMKKPAPIARTEPRRLTRAEHTTTTGGGMKLRDGGCTESEELPIVIEFEDPSLR